MDCIKCGYDTKVHNSRHYNGNMYRQRECLRCGFRFWTKERLIENTTEVSDMWRDYNRQKREVAKRERV